MQKGNKDKDKENLIVVSRQSASPINEPSLTIMWFETK